MSKEFEEQEINSIEDIMRIANGELEEPVAEPPKEEEPEPKAGEELPPQPEEIVEPINAMPEEPASPAPVEVETFAPDFSYKVKGEEKQFDERFHGIVKTKEDEEFIRQLYTKADALDGFKERLTGEEQARQEMEQQLALSTGFYQDLVAKRDGKDWRGVSKAIGYSEDDILNMAIEIAKEREMPEEQRQVAQNNRLLAEQNAMLEAHRLHSEQTMVQDASANLANQQTQELTSGLEGDYAELAGAMTSNGLDFMQEAINVGRGMTAANGGIEPAVADVMKAVADKYSFVIPKVEVQPAQPAQLPVQKQKTALPVVGGATGNPVAVQPMSIEDLQKIADRFNKQSY